MSSIPLVALNVRPVEQPDVAANYGRLLQLKGIQQEQQQRAAAAPFQQQQLEQQTQAGGIQLQQAQQAQKDQQAMSASMSQWDGKSIDDLAPLVIKNGGSANAVMGLKAKSLEMKQQAAKIAADDATTGAKNIETATKKNDIVIGALNSMKDVPNEQLPQALLSKAQELAQQGLLDPQHVQLAQQLAQSGNPQVIRSQLDNMAKGMMSFSQALDQAKQQEDVRHNTAVENTPSAAMQGLNDFLKSKEAVKGSPLTAAEGMAARNEYYQRNKSSVSMSSADGNDIKDAADMIKSGQAPPVLTEYSFRDRTKLAAELHRQGYNLAGAEQDWKATQKFLQTANGAQQTRLRQAITALPDLTDKIQGLYDEWTQIAPTSGFKVLNKASLAAMKNLPGRPGAVAQALDAQIADAVSDLAVVYMGGNSPTDHGLGLAQKNLSADWNDATFREGLKQLKLNAQIRKNSLSVGPTGVSSGSQYPIGGGSTEPASGVNASDPFSQFGGKAH